MRTPPSPVESRPQPCARLQPVALYGAQRHVERLGRLLLSQPGEVPALDDAHEPGLRRGELAEGTVDVEVADLVTHWLPLPYPTRSVQGVEGDWFWQPSTLTARSLGASAGGQDYEAAFIERFTSRYVQPLREIFG